MTYLIRVACTCCDSSIQIRHHVDRAASATWEIWKSVKEDREIGGAKTQVTITKKITHNGTIDERVEAANTLMPRFKRHYFSMKHQQAYYMTDIECMVHVDYAGNYFGKSAREVLATHFGAPHLQITLLTEMCYVDKDVEKTFCTLSDNTHTTVPLRCHLRHATVTARRPFVQTSISVCSQVLIYTAEWTVATWYERNCQSFKTAARGFEPGFSWLRARRSNRYTTAPHMSATISVALEPVI